MNSHPKPTFSEITQQDMHVHSTFSDGKHSPKENCEFALNKGLTQITLVDHVRHDTTWLPQFQDCIQKLNQEYALDIYSGAETKILNQQGDLDVPSNIDCVDYIYAADHQFPLGNHYYTPKSIQEMFAQKKLHPKDALESLLESYHRLLEKYPNLVLAHLFSILPKIGLSENMLHQKQLFELALQIKKYKALVEVDERWRCPSIRIVQVFSAMGIPILWSSDSHRKEKIGKYIYNLSVYHALRSKA